MQFYITIFIFQITMDNSRPVNDSLFNLSLNELCQSMDKETMRKLLDDYPPKIILKVIWKVKKKNI